MKALTSGDFCNSDHQIIFNAMLGLRGEQQPIDTITLTEFLAKNRQSVLGGLPAVAYISALQDGIPRIVNATRLTNARPSNKSSSNGTCRCNISAATSKCMNSARS